MLTLTVMAEPEQTEFERAAAERRSSSLLGELWGLIVQNKKWWLLPLVAALLIFGVLVLLASTGVAPFIYTLF
jgi:hypothetical protein